MIKTGHNLSNDAIAQRYFELSSKIHEPYSHYEYVSREISKMKCVNILEVGCGQGNLIKALKVKGISKNYFGIDINRASVENTQKWVLNPNNVTVGTVYNIPFSNNFFDLIILMDVIEHLKNPILAFENISKKLTVDGKILLTVPNATAFKPSIKFGEKSKNKLIQYAFLPWEHPLKTKQPIDTMIFFEEYLEIFKTAGFEVEKIKGWNYFPFFYSFPKVNQIVALFLSPLNGIFDKLKMQKYAYSLLFVLRRVEK